MARGGAREGSGRNPISDEEKKVQVNGYIKKKDVLALEKKYNEKISKIIVKLIEKELKDSN